MSVPLDAPRGTSVPSPKLTLNDTIWLALPLGIVAVLLKPTGVPAVTVPTGSWVTDNVGTGFTLMVTLAVAGPDDEPPPPVLEPPAPDELPLELPAPIPAAAVTVASRLVVNVVTARPFASLRIEDSARTPAVVVKMIGTNGSTLPLISVTVAVSLTGVSVPPAAETIVGLAPRMMRPTAAAPTAIRTFRSPAPALLFVPVFVLEAPPDPRSAGSPR